MYAGFAVEQLDDRHTFFCGRVPEALMPDAQTFEQLWAMHPDDFHEITIHGRRVKTPRWQQAFGRDYHYTHRTNKALSVPPLLQPFLEWSTRTIDDRLNGLLLNWYDPGHYIGRHRDSIANMVEGAPIVTISLGEERTFRLRPWKEAGIRDFQATDGAVFIMPYQTNRAWTHEVPRSPRYTGRRISITLRAFHPE